MTSLGSSEYKYSFQMRVAGLVILVRSDVAGLLKSMMEMYQLYLLEGDFDPDLKVDIHVEDMRSYIRTEAIPVPTGEPWVSSHYLFSGSYLPEEHQGKILVGLDNAFILVEEYLRTLLSYRCLNEKKLLFHCAALADEETGLYLFFGPSGIGKSTLSRNAKQLKVLGDDLLVLGRKDGSFSVEKIPFTRDKKPLDQPGEFSLKGIFRLHQNEEESVRKMAPSETILKTMGNLFQIYQSQEIAAESMSVLMHLFGDIPAYDLYLQKNSDFEALIL